MVLASHGGVGYVAEVLNCSRRTIDRGLVELDDLTNDPAAGRVRRPGAGRKKRVTVHGSTVSFAGARAEFGRRGGR